MTTRITRSSLGGIMALLLLIALTACNQNVVYKAHEDIKDGQWYANNSPVFNVTIADTSQKYNVYYLLRNALQYPYYNLYLTRGIKGPEDTLQAEELVELILSDETTGKPFGDGLGDMFDHKILFLEAHTFPKPGVYTFTLSQSMRQNPLPFILSVGICVEKAAEE